MIILYFQQSFKNRQNCIKIQDSVEAYILISSWLLDVAAVKGSI